MHVQELLSTSASVSFYRSLTLHFSVTVFGTRFAVDFNAKLNSASYLLF